MLILLLETKVTGNESFKGRKFPGTKVPKDESSTYGTFVLGNLSSRAWKFHESCTPQLCMLKLLRVESIYFNFGILMIMLIANCIYNSVVRYLWYLDKYREYQHFDSSIEEVSIYQDAMIRKVSWWYQFRYYTACNWIALLLTITAQYMTATKKARNIKAC